jgi:hypothetical protein
VAGVAGVTAWAELAFYGEFGAWLQLSGGGRQEVINDRS